MKDCCSRWQYRLSQVFIFLVFLASARTWASTRDVLETTSLRIQAIYQKEFKKSLLSKIRLSVKIRDFFKDGLRLYQLELVFTDNSNGKTIFKSLTDVFENIEIRPDDPQSAELFYSAMEYQFSMEMKSLYAVPRHRKDLFLAQPVLFAQKVFWKEQKPFKEISVFYSLEHALLKGPGHPLNVGAHAFASWLSGKTKHPIELEQLEVLNYAERLNRGETSARPGFSLVIAYFQFYDDENQLVSTERFEVELPWNGYSLQTLNLRHIYKFYSEILGRIDFYLKFHNFYNNYLGFSHLIESPQETSCVQLYRWLNIHPGFNAKAASN